MPITNKELYFNSLAQPHWDIFSRNVSSLIQSNKLPKPTVFISYAWPTTAYPGYEAEKDIQPWLLNLYQRLTALGVNVLFDIQTMQLGTHINKFMEEGVNQADVVLMIGTTTYKTRSSENTSVKREVDLIQAKLTVKGQNCVIPLLYRGGFHDGLPNLGQILGIDVRYEITYQQNLPTLIERLFKLKDNPAYQKLKENYVNQLKEIEQHGLSDSAVETFRQTQGQLAREVLARSREQVELFMARNAAHHPDYVPRPTGEDAPSIKALELLKIRYKQHTHIQALFGEPLPLEGQYINVQMLHQVQETHIQEKTNGSILDINPVIQTGAAGRQKDIYLTSREAIFSEKKPLNIDQLFIPATQLLKNNQKNKEQFPERPPRFILLQGLAGVGKTTFVHYVSREWAMGRLWSNYHWVISLRFRDLGHTAFSKAQAEGRILQLRNWVYHTHFAHQMDKQTFNPLWDNVIQPDMRSKKVLFILDGYDEAPLEHPCQEALTQLLNSDTPVVLTSRPYGLANLPRERRDLEVAGFVDENVDTYINLYFHKDPNKAQTIRKTLRNTQGLWASAHIPVILNVICGVLTHETDIQSGIDKLNTLGKQYLAMEMALLERAYLSVPNQEAPHLAQLKHLDAEGKAVLLSQQYHTQRREFAKLAFDMFVNQQQVFSLKQVNETLGKMGVLAQACSQHIDSLLKLGLLKPVTDDGSRSETQYEFLHLSFQEYYAGQHLCWKLENNDPDLVQMLNEVRYNPRYQLLLWFTAGAIKHKGEFDRFIRALATPEKVDMLGHVQLALLVRCTEENWELAQTTGWNRIITRQLQKRISGLWQRNAKISERRHRFQERSDPPSWVLMLRQSNRHYIRQTGTEDMCHELPMTMVSGINNKKEVMRFIKYLGFITPATSNTVVNSLNEIEADNNRNEANEAMEVIQMLGLNAVTPALLDSLPSLLSNHKEEVCQNAIEIVKALRSEAATKIFVSALPRLLNDNRKMIRYAVIHTICALNTPAATEALLAALPHLLQGNDDVVCLSAIAAIGALNNKTASKNFAAALPFLLAKKETRHSAIETIKALNDEAATQALLEALPHILLERQDLNLQYYALKAMMALTITSIPQNLLKALPRLLADNNSDVRHHVINTIKLLNTEAVTQIFVAALPLLLEDNDQRVHYCALELAVALQSPDVSHIVVETLSRLLAGNHKHAHEITLNALQLLEPYVVATPAFLTVTLGLVKDPSIETCFFIPRVFRALANHPLPTILEALPRLLADKEGWVRSRAINIISELNCKDAREIFLKALPGLLADNDNMVRSSAINTIAILNHENTTEIFIKALPGLLAETDSLVKSSAINTIAKLNNEAAKNIFLKALPSLLEENDGSVHLSIAEAIAARGLQTATALFLRALPNLLTHDNWQVRNSGIRAIAILNCETVTRIFLDTLPRLLADDNVWIKSSTRNACKEIKLKVLPPSDLDFFVTSLVDWVKHPHHDINHLINRLDEISELGSLATRPAVLDALRSFVEVQHHEVTGALVRTIKALGTIIATTVFLEDLFNLLVKSYENFQIRMQVLNVIEAFASNGSPALLDILPRLLIMPRSFTSGDRNGYEVALRIIESLGPHAATPAILNALQSLLDNEVKKANSCFCFDNSHELSQVIYAIIALRSEAGTAIILNILPIVLKSKCDSVALSTITTLGLAAATPAILVGLLYLLTDNKNQGWGELIFTLTHISGNYLNTQSSISKIHSFIPIAMILITGGYLSGNTSFYIDKTSNNATKNYLKGFVDKSAFCLELTTEQVEWFIKWAPQIIQSLDKGTFAQLLPRAMTNSVVTGTQYALLVSRNSSFVQQATGSPTPGQRNRTDSDKKEPKLMYN